MVNENSLKDAYQRINQLGAQLKGQEVIEDRVLRQLWQLQDFVAEVLVGNIDDQRCLLIEERLWTLRTHFNDLFRSHLSTLPRHERVRRRKKERFYLKFLKGSQVYCRKLITSLSAKTILRRKLKNNIESVESPRADDLFRSLHPVSDDQNSHANQLSCCSLNRLGDLSRWREQGSTKSSCNWLPSLRFYRLAEQIRPGDGVAKYKQSLVATLKEDTLGAIYHLYRSLACAAPCWQSWQSLDEVFRSTIGKDFKAKSDGNESGRTHTYDPHNLTTCLSHTLSACFHTEVSNRKVVEDTFFTVLESYLEETESEDDSHKIITIIIAAESIVQTTLQDGNRFSFSIEQLISGLRLSAKLFSMLSSHLIKNLDEEGVENPSRADQAHTPHVQLRQKTRKSILLLRQASAWFLLRASWFTNEIDDPELNEVSRQMLSRYRTVLGQLSARYRWSDLPKSNLLLKEDEIMANLAPFQDKSNPRLCARLNVHGITKQRADSSECSDVLDWQQTLTRIRDILEDGQYVAELEDSPLHLAKGGERLEGFFTRSDIGVEEASQQTGDITHISETYVSGTTSSSHSHFKKAQEDITHISQTKLMLSTAPPSNDRSDSRNRGGQALDTAHLGAESVTGLMHQTIKLSASYDDVNKSYEDTDMGEPALPTRRSNLRSSVSHDGVVAVSSSLPDIPDPTCTASALDQMSKPFDMFKPVFSLEEPFVQSSNLFRGSQDDSPRRSLTPLLGQPG